MKTTIARSTLPKTARLCAGALALFAGLSLSAQTVSTNTISLTTFEPDAAPGWSYGYFYSNNGLGTYENNRAFYLPEDVDMTNALYQFGFDLTDLSGTLGYGTGTGAPLTVTDPSGFVSGNRADYIITFDARAEGLAEGQTSGNAEMQVQFYMPNADATDVVRNFQVNLPFQPTAEWTTFRIALDEGSLPSDVSAAAFETNYTATTQLRFNVNLHEPHNQFDYDAGNVLFLDNVKVEAINRPTTPPVTLTPVTMAEWNFDDKPVGNVYSYQWSQNANQPVPTAGNNPNGGDPNTVGKDGSSGWFFNLDNSTFVSEKPDWAGGGTGGNGPVDFTLFSTNDLARYRVTFDARVEGLASDRETTTTVLQLHMDAPDDTFQPADEDANADFVIRLDVPISQVSSNWQTYTVTLDKANVGSGSKALFAQHHAAITGLRTQWQIENIASEADWGFDAENTLIIDNFKLERLFAEGENTGGGTGPTLNAAHENGQLVLNWTAPEGAYTLQSTENLGGEWSDVDGATSGYAAPTIGTMRFFRLVQEQTQ
ncbi:MAG TPA: hypothetical protein VF773_09235 [Verrucomicrobiae bacterium]